jgi:hypothetical protein
VVKDNKMTQQQPQQRSHRLSQDPDFLSYLDVLVHMPEDFHETAWEIAYNDGLQPAIAFCQHRLHEGVMAAARDFVATTVE